jgi:hypothetical protein
MILVGVSSNLHQRAQSNDFCLRAATRMSFLKIRDIFLATCCEVSPAGGDLPKTEEKSCETDVWSDGPGLRASGSRKQ